MSKRTVWKAALLTFHILVGGYALFLLINATLVHAQDPYQLAELQRRIGSIEGLNLDHRLTVLETLLQDVQTSNFLNRFTMGGTGLLIGERVVAAIRRKTLTDDKED